MTKRTVTVEIDLDFVAAEVNAAAGEDVETAATVAVWVDDNPGMLRGIVQDGVAMQISEGYE